jgi:putative CocE/NonD family hydrolase
VRWYLQEQRGLSTATPSDSAPDKYRYDPADPTPVAGGNSLNSASAGPHDNRSTEARADVLTYSSAVLDADVTVIGPVSAELHVRSSLDHTDFFVRLCDVSPNGRSTNICDGIVRLSPSDIQRRQDGSFTVRVEMTPTANTFLCGHRIRVQIASAAFPLYSRNTGTGEPNHSAVRLVAAEQQVMHDPEHPSSIELPIVSLP